MAFQIDPMRSVAAGQVDSGFTSDAQMRAVPQTDAVDASVDVDVTSIGVDVMKIALPRYEQTLTSFVNNIADAVSCIQYNLHLHLWLEACSPPAFIFSSPSTHGTTTYQN